MQSTTTCRITSVAAFRGGGLAQATAALTMFLLIGPAAAPGNAQQPGYGTTGYSAPSYGAPGYTAPSYTAQPPRTGNVGPRYGAQFGPGPTGGATRPLGTASPRNPAEVIPTPGDAARSGRSRFRPEDAGQPVVAVKIDGNRVISTERFQQHIRTRVGRPFQPDVVQADVSRLFDSKLVQNVRTFVDRVPEGVIVRYEVFERPIMQYVRYIGNRAFTDRGLAKLTGLKSGQSMNAYAVEEARRKIEDHYHSKGFPKTEVSVFEGNRPKDRGAVFYIAEGKEELIARVRIVGNNPSLATDARLRTKIESKPGLLWLFGGKVDRTKIDEDAERLTAYYRSLGYFQTRVSRELQYDASGRWLTLTFVIDEGPRYVVRYLRVEGNSKFAEDPLREEFKIRQGEYFNQAAMNHDVNMLRDLYGSQGYVFADIKPDVRFLEEPGELDLTFRIDEGKQFRVGRINIHVDGDYPHTKRSVILNRLSFSPGQIIDIRKIRDSERRLKLSQLFENNPSQGVAPKIVFRLPELDEAGSFARGRSNRPTTLRGQNPTARQAQFPVYPRQTNYR